MPSEKTERRPGADLDEWVWQMQILDDLIAFVRRHGPTSASPLPTLNWTLGVTLQAGAELPTYAYPDPLPTLKAFGAVLGSEVTVKHLPDRLIYAVLGRIGRKEGTAKLPRTQVVVRAVVFHPLDDEETER